MSYDYLFLTFPNLIFEGFTPTSPACTDYNCIARAAHDDENWWWPFTDPGAKKESYWPRSVPNKQTIKTFIKVFQMKGFKRIADIDLSLEDGFEKVAIYALGTKPTHAARQLPDGNWTHKLGQNIDITASLNAMVGTEYGNVVCVMKRNVK